MKNWYIGLGVSIAVLTGVLCWYDATIVTKGEYADLLRSNSSYKNVNLTPQQRKQKGLPPNQYFERQSLLEINPFTGKTHPENISKLQQKQQRSLAKFAAVPGENEEMKWVERGPNNIGGRTRVLFYDPNDVTGKRVFAGGVSGGLWSNEDITDNNSTWTQVGIDENLAVSSYAIDPNDANNWYIATGESYTFDDGVGSGLWQSTNGGATWNKILGVNLNGTTASNRLYAINKVVTWNNNGSTEVFIAVDAKYDYEFVGYNLSGWWKSTDGGLNFNKVVLNTSGGTPYVFSDVEIAADNSLWFGTKSNAWGVGGGKIFRSTNGTTFTEKYSFNYEGRVELGVSKQNSNNIYAIGEISTGVSLVKSTNGFSTNSAMAKPNDADDDISADDFTRGQAFYDLTLEVDPTDDTILYAGGIDLFRSSNSGTSWSQISKWSNNNSLAALNVSLVHADMHAVAFSPLDHNQAVIGNDGGVYFSNSLSSSGNNSMAIVDRNNGYNVTQFYSAAIGQNQLNEMFLGGAQDNGSLFVQNATAGINSFTDIFGGDGAHTFIDKDGQYAIVSYVYNYYALQPLPFVSISQQNEFSTDQNSGDFINVADLDDNLDILYSDGTSGSTYRIARYKNLLTTPVRQNLSNALLTGRPTAIKVSPFTTATSTVFIGTEDGDVLKVTKFSGSAPVWTKISTGINTGSISDIALGASENEIIVTLHNYGVESIYYTEDGGTTWASKEGDFPDIPIKAVLMNPLNNDEVIIGTNLGVWKSNNFKSVNPTWTQSQNGMSNVRVTKFDYRTIDTTVIASTYGRGLFTGKFSGNGLGSPTISNTNLFTVKNLVEDNVVINSTVIQKTARLTITSLSGSIVVNKILDFTNADAINVPIDLKNGVYIIHIESAQGSASKKIMVSK